MPASAERQLSPLTTESYVEMWWGWARSVEFSDRLTDNGEELQRVIAFAVDAVWKNNGSQQDLVTSEAKLKAAVVA